MAARLEADNIILAFLDLDVDDFSYLGLYSFSPRAKIV